jgi:serine/threonine protein phosphatase 1
MSCDAADITVTDWIPAPIALPGETVFAIGDVHGCAPELKLLLDSIATARSAGGNRRRLVFLGDVIDRGPDNIGALRLWAGNEAARGVDRIDRLMGNHEQLMMLAMSNSLHAKRARTKWLGMGGARLLAELRAACGSRDEQPSAALFAAALGPDILRQLQSMQSHVAVGNLILVHGGLDPTLEHERCLSAPWTAFTDARWAWVRDEFLTWRGGFNGRIVVHGHTPPHKHRRLTGQDDPHCLAFGRLGLDGGTTRTGAVVGAQLETGRYRILSARVAAEAYAAAA